MEYHITFKENEKIISCNESSFLIEVNRHFGTTCSCPEDFVYKLWSEKWASWVDASYDEVMREGQKIKLELNYHQSPILPYSIPTSFMTSSFDEHMLTNPLESAPLPPNTDTLAEIGGTKTQKPWPHVFPVPEMPTCVVMKEAPLDKKDFRIVVEYMYHTMSNYKLYPNSQQYTAATEALLTKYPKLSLEYAGKSATSLWKTKLMDKFRNERKRHYPETAFSPKKCKQKKPSPVQCPIGEDATSLLFHKEFMKKEYGKKDVDVANITYLMDITVSLRNFPKQPLVDCFKEFPFLQDPNQMIKEVFRTKQLDILSSLKTNAEKLSSKLWKGELSHSEVILKVIDFLNEKFEHTFLKQTMQDTPAPLLIISQGNSEDAENLFVDVVAEGSTIFRHIKIDVAVPAFLALHDVFDVEYVKKTGTIAAWELLFGFPCSFRCKKRGYLKLLDCINM